MQIISSLDFNLRDGSGSISASELHQVFAALDLKPTEEEMNAVMKQMDKNGHNFVFF